MGRDLTCCHSHFGRPLAVWGLIRFAALAFGTVLAAAAHAEEINLLCTARNGSSCTLYVDTDQKYLTYCQSEYEDGLATAAEGKQYVEIDGGSIRFGTPSTVHRLDRYTGILIVELKCVGPNKSAAPCAATGLGGVRYDPISCTKMTKKF